MTNRRRSSPLDEQRALAQQHAQLKARVAEYTARRHLTPGEQLELNALRVMKLRTKDKLHAVARRLEPTS